MRHAFIATLVVVVMAGFQTNAQQTGDEPLSPFARAEISRYVPGEDLSNLTMRDFRRISNIIHSGSERGTKRGRVKQYIQNVNAKAAAAGS